MVDSTNVPVAGASVSVVGFHVGTLTNSSGNFHIIMPNAAQELQISSVGYLTKKVSVNKDTLLIVLEMSNSRLSDVVVIGSQEFTRKKLTAAVSSISGDVIENLPAASFDQLLQGRIAGLNVQVASGEPGVAPSLVVRGNSTVNTSLSENSGVSQAQALSTPLYVIDGVPIDPSQITNNYDVTGTNYLAGININDIASIDVEKDAAATAAWGSRGANGVIYIKTRMGKSKTPAFEVNIYGTYNPIPKLITTYTGEEERLQKMKIINAYYPNLQYVPTPLPQILTDSLNPFYNNAIDWQRLFYGSATTDNVDISMSQASDAVNYRVSGNYFNQPGVIKQFGYERYSFNGNFNFNISKKLNSQLIVSLSHENRKRGAKFNNSDQNTPFSGAGNEPSSFYQLSAYDSSEYLGIAGKLRNQNTDLNLIASWTTNYKITPWLDYTLMGSATSVSSNKDYFSPSNSSSIILNLEQYGGSTIPSYAEADRNVYSTYYLRNTFNFHKTITVRKDHHHDIGLVVSQEYNTTQNNYSTVSGYNVPSNAIQTVTGVPQSNLQGGSDYQKDALLSFTQQLQYDYDTKYLLSVGLRQDGSSRFGTNHKWGIFPAASIGWMLSDEKFMSNVKKTINYLKIRASLGVSGNQAGSYYAPYNAYTTSGTYDGTTAILPSYSKGITNHDLSWAKIIQKDLGMDLTMFDSRINITADIYDKVTKNDFWTFNIPYFTGYNSIYINSPDLWINNKGLDLSITTHNLSPASKFQWNSNIVFSYNRNIVAKLPNNNQVIIFNDYSGASRILAVGQPVYEFFQLKYLGVYNHANDLPYNPQTGAVNTYWEGNRTIQPGDPIFQNTTSGTDVWVNEINGNPYGSRQPTGDPNPRYTGGFNNDFSFKNFYLSIMCIYSIKRTIINNFEQSQYVNFVGGGISGFASSSLPETIVKGNYWTPEKALDPNYKASIPSINPYNGYWYQFNSSISNEFNVEGSYFKVKYVTLSYLFPKKILNRLKMKGLKVYASMSNILIIKNKNNTLPDPESVDQTGTYTGGLYPQAKTFQLGITMQF